MAEEKELYVVSTQLRALAEKMEELKKTAAGCLAELDKKPGSMEVCFKGRGGAALQEQFRKETEQCRERMEKLQDFAERLQKIAAEYEAAEKENQDGAERACCSFSGNGQNGR